MKPKPRRTGKRPREPRRPNLTTYKTILEAILNLQTRVEKLEGREKRQIGFTCAEASSEIDMPDMDAIAEDGGFV